MITAVSHFQICQQDQGDAELIKENNKNASNKAKRNNHCGMK